MKTHCPAGHEYTGANTKVYKNRRFCRACNNGKSAKYADLNPQAKRRWAWKKQGLVGFTTDAYERLWKDQGGQCAVCSAEIRLYGSARNDGDACVDHDHSTGQVRGLLCRRCNLGIGFLGDTHADLARASEYLQPEYGGVNAGCL